MDEHKMILVSEAVIDQALEALEYPGPSWLDARQPAITALRQAIAEEALRNVARLGQEIEQEPVAKNEEGRIKWLVDNWPQNCLLYTSPPKRGEAEAPRQPLTDEQIDKFRSGYQAGRIGSFVGLVRAIEAAHGIKESEMYIQQDKPLLTNIMDEIANIDFPVGDCRCPHCKNPIRFPIIAKQSDVELFETVMRSAYEVMDRYGITVNLLAEIRAQCVVAIANQKAAHGIKE